MNSEQLRINFIEERDGKEAAMQFVKQTYQIYKTALLMSRRRKSPKVHFASLLEYRRSFIESCVVFRSYLRQN